ncbi:unnamed protein product [Vicia faba]|uniref:Uncharacterized protein n=1 Tax=Vicia faba TaxID=3906 RepID=A0AAV1B4M4_VICFA|nr:unnamed protein product [Vicia faba]
MHAENQSNSMGMRLSPPKTIWEGKGSHENRCHRRRKIAMKQQARIKRSPKSLSKIGSAIDTPLVTDECTANKLRVSYARILVEVDITHNLAKEVIVKDREGQIMKQPIEYEWKTLFCETCHKGGHKCEAKTQKLWRPKFKVTEEGKLDTKAEDTSNVAGTSNSEATKKDDWHKTSRTTRNKGKTPQLIGSPGTIHCENVFETLDILNYPLVPQDSGQC